MGSSANRLVPSLIGADSGCSLKTGLKTPEILPWVTYASTASMIARMTLA